MIPRGERVGQANGWFDRKVRHGIVGVSDVCFVLLELDKYTRRLAACGLSLAAAWRHASSGPGKVVGLVLVFESLEHYRREEKKQEILNLIITCNMDTGHVKHVVLGLHVNAADVQGHMTYG